MTNGKKSPAAGGILIAIGATAGPLLGAYYGQPSAGLLIGVGAGIALAVLVWLMDR